MARDRDLVGKSDAWASWAQRVGAGLFWLLQLLGLKEAFTASVLLVIAIVWTALVQMLDRLPFWGSAAAGLLLAWLTLRVINAAVRAWKLRGIKTIDAQVIGRQCVDLSDEMLKFLADRADAAQPRSHPLLEGDPASIQNRNAMRQEWQKHTEYDRKTSARGMERFGARIVASARLLQSLGVKPPELFAMDHQLASIGIYVGAVGQLLQLGLLEEARALDPRDTWAMRVH